MIAPGTGGRDWKRESLTSVAAGIAATGRELQEGSALCVDGRGEPRPYESKCAQAKARLRPFLRQDEQAGLCHTSTHARGFSLAPTKVSTQAEARLRQAGLCRETN